MSDAIQVVTLVTADGRRLVYSGRAQLDPTDMPRIVDILASPPRPLPDGYEWAGVEAKDQ